MNTSRFTNIKPPTPELAVSPTTPDFNGVGSKVNSYAEQHNVPRLVHPKSATEKGPAPSPVAEPSAPPQPADKPSRATGSSPTRRLTVDVPEYLLKDIKDRSTSKDVTVKYTVVTAFHKAGFHVAAADLIEDGRRGK
jgi:hypothetical protein